LSRLRAGLTDDARTVFNLSEEVYMVAGRFDYLSEVGHYKIDTKVEDDIYTNASKERIEQVLYNLIGNAFNYTGADKRVRVKLFRKEECARFEVIDSGKGIPPEEIETIWDRYYRSNKTHKRPVKGTGLGLSIVKGILVAQDCPFGGVSDAGKGSCFWVEFPLVKDDIFEKDEGSDRNMERKRTRKKRKGERHE
ncbi:MAG: HAMP domain-containing histidine kinase, partial [Clostridia bacterium]|nr:HAMP domain-containing histidine kinase [Clostridia bacterium]